MSWEVRTMRSGTSFFNSTLYRKTMLRFWPLWVAYGLMWLFLLPFNLLNNYFSMRGASVSSVELANRLVEYARDIPNTLQFGVFVACGYGVLCAMAVFGYLYNNRSACMMHALPLRRETLFGTQYLAGLSFVLLPNLVVAGKTVVVAGYGWCGKGVAMRASGMGANVIVTEVDPFKALDATMNGFRVMPMDEAARCGDVFVTVTGCKDVITPRHFAVMKHNALLTNAGHFDCEVDVAGLAAMAVGREVRRENIEGYTLPDGRVLNVLGEGRLVNLAAGNGHPAEIMDMSFAVQALALEWLVRHRQGLERKVYQVPDEIDEEIGRVKLAALGLAIDALTPEQQAYLNGWKAE